MALVVRDDENTNNQQCEENGPSKMFQKLYELEKRVEALRDQALSIEQEKCSVLASLQGIQDNDWLLTLSAEEKEEIEANAERLVCRCLTVEVSVTTPRNEIQERALSRVSDILQELEAHFSIHNSKSVLKANSYLNACLTECSGKMIDHRFQGLLLDCTADDQKAIKRRLQKLLETCEKIEENNIE